MTCQLSSHTARTHPPRPLPPDGSQVSPGALLPLVLHKHLVTPSSSLHFAQVSPWVQLSPVASLDPPSPAHCALHVPITALSLRVGVTAAAGSARSLRGLEAGPSLHHDALQAPPRAQVSVP